MKMMREGGILMHITALPGQFGIGDLGETARKFIDFMAEAGISLWQICPLGPTGYGNSPYQCYSAFAGNTLLIDLEILLQEGLLEKQDLEKLPDFPAEEVDFDLVRDLKTKIFRKAFTRFDLDNPAFFEFCSSESLWLDDFTIFMSLKDHFKGVNWLNWDDDIKTRKSLDEYRSMLKDEIDFQKFLQFNFFKQWKQIQEYANSKGIKIIGDIPIYVAADSADVWAEPSLFQLDENMNPTRVAGYPPDAFSKTGQLWGNPLFDWEKHLQTDFSWWKKRIASSLKLYDYIRLDHFLGFARYWSIPAGDNTAENGEWIEGPKAAIFSSLQEHFGDLPLIAEDLGNITQDVTDLRLKFGFPGMKILQFAFGSGDGNPYLPHNAEETSVIYTGTHDNETSAGWLENIPRTLKEEVVAYLDKFNAENIIWQMINSIWSSNANFAIAPMQDFLNLDNTVRFNTPGTMQNNWNWRMPENAISENLTEKIKKLNKNWGR